MALSKNIFLTIAGLGLAALPATNADATRTLYTFTDNGFYGDSVVVQVHSSFSFIVDQTLPIGSNIDYTTLTCLDGKQLCDSVETLRRPKDLLVTYGSEVGSLSWDFIGPGSLVIGANISESQVSLADTDVVYSYVDTSGVALTFVSNGYLDLSSTTPSQVNPLSCAVQTASCSTASVTGGPTAFLQAANSYPTTAATVQSLAIPRTLLQGYGSFSLHQNGVYAQLNVVAPLAFADPAVPEPATWAMIIAGFGVAGATMRRRRAALSCV